jgi:serine/threonine-protein kinase
MEKTTEELTRGTTFVSRYEVIEELGKGGMGKVYRVFDKKLDEEVALKLIKPEIASNGDSIDRFSNELKFARKVAHRNVCKMYDLGEKEGTNYITMEYVHGVRAWRKPEEHDRDDGAVKCSASCFHSEASV